MPALDNVSEKAQALHRKSILIDGVSFFVHGYTDVIEESGLTAISITTPMPWDELEATVNQTENLCHLIENTPELSLLESVQDIYDAKEAGQTGLILSAQSPMAIATRLTRVQTMARLGYRIIQLTYSERNFVGDGCNEQSDIGLSRFGEDLVREMNRQGIVIDLSHAGQRTALEAAQLSDHPVIVSHTSVRSLYPSNRNLIDEVIDAVAAKGGVIGACTFGLLNWDGKSKEMPPMENYLRAVDYLVERVGIDHVGFSSDSEATTGGYPEEVHAELGRRYGQLGSDFHDAVGDVTTDQVTPFRGMQDLPMITEALLDRGYSEEDVQKIMGLNFVRVFDAVWPK